MALDKQEADWMYGRMMEDCDIALAIESGQFTSLDDVLKAVNASASAIQAKLEAEGMKFARSVSVEELEHVQASYEAGLPSTVKH